MENILNYFKIIIASLGTALTWLFGAWDTTLMVLNQYLFILDNKLQIFKLNFKFYREEKEV